MKILITNDDGVRAGILIPLARWARRLGEVVVAAPKFEQSGKSHGIEIHKPFEVKQISLAPDITAYSVDSTPADCVRYAAIGLNQHYDLVISGINRGYNLGRDIIYSGTVGAVFEAAGLGMKGIAISADPHSQDKAVEQLDAVFDYFRDHQLLDKNGLYNINIPAPSKGIRITRQGDVYYADSFLPVGNDLYQPVGECVYQDAGNDDLDTDAVTHGYISVTPLTIDRTHLETFRELAALNE